MISIQTNVNSLVAQQNLNVNSAFQSKTIQQLTSGYRINSSGDDAAGLALANKDRNQVSELTQGVSNGNDGVAQLQIMDGGMSNISMILDRLKTLAMQSSSDSYTGGVSGRQTLNSEFQTDIQEIDRQAQSIGLNTGGTFAKNLAIYLGAGNGSQTQSNSVVNVDLSKSTCDSQSLGLTGVTAVNANTYDLGDASATSVHNIVNNAANVANEKTAGFTQFTFFGAGFSNDTSQSSPSNSGITVDVNLNGVGDTNSLVDAINQAISSAAEQPTSAAAAFKAAGITAQITTDASGNQKLSFSSGNSAFEVDATDKMSSALMGNFAYSGSAVGAVMGSTVVGAATSFTSFPTNASVTITGAGLSSPVTVSVNSSVATAASLAGSLQTSIRAAMGGATTISVSANGSSDLVFKTSKGAIQVTSSGDPSDKLGLSSTNGNTVAAASTKMYGTLVSGGAYELGSTNGSSASVTNFNWVKNIASGSQAVTITATDANGSTHATTVNLTSATGSGDSLKDAVATINSQLQKGNDSTLQQITAVVVNDNGVQKINFTSTLSDFKVSLGTTPGTTSSIQGIADSTFNATTGVTGQGTTTGSVKYGSGGALDISTIQDAQAAVTAITNAVNQLGLAQAAVGKGENVLNFAINLAQSQITNISAAESNIRDANVAQEAANLTKAQVLQQASMAAMAQANSAPQAVLSLLRG